MSDEEILGLIREALLYVVPDKSDAVGAVDWNTTISGLGIDSIGLLEASAYIEEKVNATFPDDRLARVEKISDFADLIRDNVSPSVTAAS